MLSVAILAGLVILRTGKFLFTELNESWIWYNRPVYDERKLLSSLVTVPIQTYHAEILYTENARETLNLYSSGVKYVADKEKKQYLITQKANEIGRQLLKEGMFKIREYNSIDAPDAYYNAMTFTHPDINVISIELKCVRPKETKPFGDDLY